MAATVSSKQKQNRIMLAGLMVVFASSLFLFVLGARAVFISHDQLDGEVLAYLMHAKYLFAGRSMAEFMNGMSKTALTPPAPLFVILYKICPPLVAFLLTRMVITVTGYLGTFLLLTKEEEVRPIFACLCGILLAFMPFLSVYGFSMYALPLLLFLSKRFIRAESKRKVWYLFEIALIAAGSSLVLAGFAVILFGIGYGIFLYVQNHDRKVTTRYCICLFTYVLVHVVLNLDLVMQVLGVSNGSYVTHKNEASILAAPILETFANALIDGDSHSSFFRAGILILGAIALLIGVAKKGKRNILWKKIRALFCIAVLCAAFEALYLSKWIVNLRNTIGGAAKWFQLSRIDWLMPGILVILLGLTFEYLWSLAEETGRSLHKTISALAVDVVFLCTFGMLLLADTWKDNLKVALGKEPSQLTWKEYYAMDVYELVDEYMQTNVGLSKEQYHVASLGIVPAAALYNGFYCVDGYSNNYDVEYKHLFRKAIAPELDRLAYIRMYFDEWGNRCYLMSSETPGYFTIEKNGFWFSDLQLDVEGLKALSCDYIFSAAYIENADEIGLTLLNEEPIETEDSYYRIYIYSVTS